jgi:phosphatidylserine decarboxylase
MQPVTLILQSLLLLVSTAALACQLWNFPYPSPLTSPFLAPEQRWSEAQIKGWVESGTFDPGFVRFFMRDPERLVPPGDNLVAPSDGVVKEIVRTADAAYFVIGLSFWDVHVVRSPVAGVVTNVEEEGLSIFRDRSESAQLVFLKGKAGPVQKIVTIAVGEGSYKVRLITSWWASRIKVSAAVGQPIRKGERLGRILLGSTVVLDAPTGMRFDPPEGSRVVGGETVIATPDSVRP